MKRPIKLFVALMAVLLVFAQVPNASAISLSDLKSQKSEIEKKKKNIQKEIKEKSNEINSIKSKQEQLQYQIKQITNQVVETTDKINEVNVQISKKNKEIEKIQAEIKELQEKIEQRDELLKDRARAIQANGEVSYIDVLLGAESFVDFIDRFSAVNTLIEADRQIMKDQKNDKRKLEEQELELKNTKKELENQKTKLNQLVVSLNEQEKEKNNLISELEKEGKNLLSEKMLLQNQYERAVELSEEINNQIAEQQRKYLKTIENNDNYKVAPGDWTNPANGYLTSPYGWRDIGFSNEFHYGIDIAKSGPNVPIYAAATGIVFYAAPLSSYGNTIIITHNMGGQIYTTVYAHLRGYNVSVGSKVTKGQRIGTMGNTGRSFGQHLHFEVHTGTWKGQKVGHHNPLNFIPGGFPTLR